MADKLTAAELAAFGQRNITAEISRTCELSNDSHGTLVLTDRIKKWRNTKFEVYNRHPDDRGRLRFPALNLTADNSGGYFDLGGTVFPNGRSDLASTTINVQVFYRITGTTFKTLMDFTGQLREPEYDETDVITLVVEHPLTVLTGRIWERQDRIGGDTGVNHSFNT